MSRLSYIFVVFMILAQQGQSDAQRVAALEDTVTFTTTRIDSLNRVQAALEGDVGRLSTLVDSLKRGSETDKLRNALRESVYLSAKLEEVYVLQRETDHMLSRVLKALQNCYDSEINTLIGSLDQAPAETLLKRLKLLQHRRKSLSALLVDREDRPDLPDIIIRPGDGPEAIQQKADFMADVAAQLKQRLDATDVRLRKLVEEQRLRRRAQDLLTEISLFDENAPIGRSLSLEPGAIAQVADDVVPSESADAEISASVANISGGRVSETFAPAGGAPEPIDLVLTPGLEIELGEGPVDAGVFGEGPEGEIVRLEQQRVMLQRQAAQAAKRAETLRSFVEQIQGEGR